MQTGSDTCIMLVLNCFASYPRDGRIAVKVYPHIHSQLEATLQIIFCGNVYSLRRLQLLHAVIPPEQH